MKSSKNTSKKEVKNRLLSCLLTLILLIGTLPTASATDDGSAKVYLIPKVFSTMNNDTPFFVTAWGSAYSDIYLADDCPIETEYYVKTVGIYTDYTAYTAALGSYYTAPETDVNGKSYGTWYVVENHAQNKYGFDSCDGTFVWDTTINGWRYWCIYGGVRGTPFTLYEFADPLIEKTILPENLTATPKTIYSATAEDQVVTNNNIDVTVNLDGKTYTLLSTQYTFTDNIINIGNGDHSVTIQYGDLYKDLTLPFLCEITLDNQNDSENEKTYQFYSKGWYSDNGCTVPLNDVTVPTREGYTFKGYFTEPSGGTQCIDEAGNITAENTAFNLNSTLYAHWVKDVVITPGTVTFKIVNGTWADNTTDDIIIAITLTDGKGTLNSSDVPTDMIAENGYENGSWNVIPNINDDGITKKTVTYTYTFTKKQPVITSSTVTFKVVNGTWADNTTKDKTVTVTLTDGKGTLNNSDIPTGMKALAGYEGGTWKAKPNTSADKITGDATYIFTFTKSESDNPKTGDTANTFMWVGLFFISIIGIVCTLSKKSNKSLKR